MQSLAGAARARDTHNFQNSANTASLRDFAIAGSKELALNR
jgi:hypothetical protein